MSKERQLPIIFAPFKIDGFHATNSQSVIRPSANQCSGVDSKAGFNSIAKQLEQLTQDSKIQDSSASRAERPL